jgi:hypothetical protein
MKSFVRKHSVNNEKHSLQVMGQVLLAQFHSKETQYGHAVDK